jgi:Domain of unknown function (DUF5615)
VLSFLTDEDLHGPIVDGIRLHHPDLDVVRAVEVGLSGLDDDILLDWAAQQGRITVSHDVSTMTDSANRRVSSGRKMSGLIVVPQSLGTARAIADLRFVAEISTNDEMENATIWLPL